MSRVSHTSKPLEQHSSGTLSLYLSGFIMSVVLTLAAYLAVTTHVASTGVLIAIVAMLATVQFLVQLFYFLHIGSGRNARWKIIALLSALSVVFIVVGGSLWIMYNLNYHMTPSDIHKYLNEQGGGI